MFKKIISILAIVSILVLPSCRQLEEDEKNHNTNTGEAEKITDIQTEDTTEITTELTLDNTTDTEQIEGTETSPPETSNSGTVVTEILSSDSKNPETNPLETTPPESMPPETEPPLDPSIKIGSLYTVGELNKLDKTKKGYGQGVNVDERNRPTGAINMQNAYGVYDTAFIRPEDNSICLTFDLGYENGYTSKILDILKEKNVKAIFFATLPYCKSNPNIVSRIINEGHILGNHSVSHLSMPTLRVDKMEAEIMGLHNYILDNYGYTMTMFRPPMGEFSEQSLAVTKSLGYKTVHWSFAYLDYDTSNQPDPTYALGRVTGAAHGGAIYLLHAISETNTAILSDVIDNLIGKGYTISLFE